MPPRIIQVFEHETLRYPGQRNGVAFTEVDFRALVRFNERHRNRYFTVLHQGVRFSQYVGVVQVGSLTVEILPKADRETAPGTEAESQACWQGVLLDMLRECRLLRGVASPAPLHCPPGSILEAYLDAFLTETEALLRKGLVKKYRSEEANQDVLKGSLQFSRHLRENAVHPERFYVRHQTYDARHPLYRVLRGALQLFPRLTGQPRLVGQAQRLASHLPPTAGERVDERTFAAIRLDRKTEGYRAALDLARLILLGYQPDLRGGREHTLAILFDMNALFEAYIYNQLKGVESGTVRVEKQVAAYFWENKRVRPDIVIRTLGEKAEPVTYVVDTKWKALRQPQPDDDDLKQMYVYNQYYRAAKSVLLYPATRGLGETHGSFRLGNPFLSDDPAKQAHGCTLQFVQLVQDGKLRKDLGASLLKGILGGQGAAG
ncbi:MAG: restriction endonuclease [Ferruginibacter sp.]|nr:restriction endonuclease [Cytophagales bacterium]